MKSKYQNHCGSVYYLEILFLVGSYTLMMPYRIMYHSQTSSYSIKLFKYRKFIIWLLQILLTIQLVMVVLHGLIADHTFKNCIIATINLSLTCWTNITLFTLVEQKQSFLKILENVENIGCSLKKWGGKTPKRCMVTTTVLLLCFGAVLISILEIIYLDLKFHIHQSSNIVLELLIRRTKYILYHISNKGSYEFLNTTSNTTALLEDPSSSAASRYNNMPELIFGSISLFVIKFYYLNVGHFGYVTLFVFTLLLSQLFSTLNTSIPKEFKEIGELEKVIQLYRDLCNLTTQVNDAIGKLLAWGILVHLPYNAYKTKDLLLNDPAKQISYLVHVCMYGGILIAGANVQSNANTIVDKVATSKLTFENEKIYSKVSLLLQMSRVGLRGAHLFQLSYGFFGNIVGVILTYAILIAQFQSHCT